MNEKFPSNNIEDYDTTLNTNESDYKYLISRLKEINATIAFLEKQYLDNI